VKQERCSVADCPERHSSKGFCKKHYWRFWKYGDPLAGADASPGPRAWSDDDRALALVALNQQRDADRAATASTGFFLQQEVRCARAAPAAGTWRRYAGKKGTVVGFTIDRAGPEPYVEVGVTFSSGGYPDAWFLPSELEAA
jgi:hypothetical protein